jgi:hypothetical protein
MPYYTVTTTVKLFADDANEAYHFIRLAIDGSRMTEILHVDSEVVDTFEDEGEYADD